ncbi:DUF624 domain-containing protein [Bifidobacterium favimelis]|uniref:DUF624 domain-containing protein n=1 Tax=Bifidobacterium favimelis TaxID=3122979 RepID=A0ABU8ZNU3_9BIFI
MNRIFSLDGPLYRFLDRVWQLLQLNVLFLLSCLPLVTVGAGLTALFSVVVSMQEEGTVKVGARFWKAFRSRLARATQAWLLIVAVLAALIGAYFLLADLTRGSQLVLLPFMVLVAFCILAAMPVFPLLALGLEDGGGSQPTDPSLADPALADPSLGRLLKASFGLGLGHVLEFGGMFLLIVLICILPVFLPRLWPLWLLFAGSLVAYPQAWLFRRACGIQPVRSGGPGGADGIGEGERGGSGRR